MNYAEIAVLANEVHRCLDTKSVPVSVISSNHSTKTIYTYIDQLHASRIQIKLHKLDYQQRFIYGRIQRYKTEALVFISDKLNVCWSRYVATKELSHLIVDTKDESLTTDMEMIVDWLISGLHANINDALDSEHSAALLAVELLVPYSLSNSELKNKNLQTYDLAIKYSVPKRIIEAMRTEQNLELRDKAFE